MSTNPLITIQEAERKFDENFPYVALEWNDGVSHEIFSKIKSHLRETLIAFLEAQNEEMESEKLLQKHRYADETTIITTYNKALDDRISANEKIIKALKK